MQESYIEGVASHDDPESCVGSREAAGEALTGARAGRVLSREIKDSGVPTLLTEAEGHTHDTAIARRHATPRGRSPLARTEAFCARTGRSLGSLAAEGAAGRIGKAKAVRR
jgi:RNA-directed DNA polymerase